MSEKSTKISRRKALKAGAAAAAAGAVGTAVPGQAIAGAEEDAIIAAAKKAFPNGQDLTGIMWSNYQRAVQPVRQEFAAATNIDIKKMQDISVFDIPARAMAEALSKSGEFDFFHMDSNMIPSLASAGLLAPLDEYMKKANFKINAVGDFGKLMTYKGKTYGIPTDGNVMVQFMRKDLMEDPEERKAFADKHGKEMAWPETWEDELELYKHFYPRYHSGNLRDRGSSLAWWYMYLYSAGGFPFTDDGDPNIDNDAGEYAVETYLKYKEVSHAEAPGWGTPQMIPRIVGGNVFACQYWDGIIALAENPKKSKTTGKWAYGQIPGSRHSGKLLKRSVSTPVVSFLVNKHSPRKEAMAYLAMYTATGKNSDVVTGDRVNTFHDPWHVEAFKKGSLSETAYTPGGVQGINDCLQVTCPALFVTGMLEFETELKRNLSEAYTGGKSAKAVNKDTTDAWARAARRIGKRRLKEEIGTYKSLMPSRDVPA